MMSQGLLGRVLSREIGPSLGSFLLILLYLEICVAHLVAPSTFKAKSIYVRHYYFLMRSVIIAKIVLTGG
jgi:cellulose synthase/poly-beta-1,6-N-acetylglucosamine synthase-like glycosyltransferase